MKKKSCCWGQYITVTVIGEDSRGWQICPDQGHKLSRLASRFSTSPGIIRRCGAGAACN